MDDFYFMFRTYGEHYHLCMIPLENAADYLPARTDHPRVANKFYAESRELITVAVKKVIENYYADERLRNWNYDIVFSHAASEGAAQLVWRQLKIPIERCFSTHACYGNTVSASVPLAMSLLGG